jgi:hypothetical protein
MTLSVVQVSFQPTALVAASGSFHLAANDTPEQVAPAASIDGTGSLSLPVQLEAAPRALPPASLALALIPLLMLLLLALRPDSSFRDWCRTSSEEFLGLFRPFRRRRHVIHDKPYLDRVLQAEFGGRLPPSDSLRSSSPRSSADPAAMDENLPSSPDEGRDLPS